MTALRAWSLGLMLACGSATTSARRETPSVPDVAALDAEAARAMAATGAKGLAIAVIDDGRVVASRAYGARDAKGEPLRTDTVMYGASITKTVFAYLVMQLADEKRIDLDTSISEYLDKPLPEYPDEDRYSTWSHLAGDERWRDITPRVLLTHSAGFANFGFLEPDERLRIHFAPGSRFAYLGDGIILM